MFSLYQRFFSVIACAAVTTLPTIASAQASGPVRSVASALCMDVFGDSQAGGASIMQWSCTGNKNQSWQLVASGDYFSLKVASSGQCMDVWGLSTAAGAGISQWTCTGGSNQQFSLRAQGSGSALVMRHSGMCVAVEGASSSAGARLVQQTCDGSASQTWKLGGSSTAASQGQWSSLQSLSIIPAAAAHLPNGKILFWSASDRLLYGSPGGRTYTSIYDPATGTATEALVTNTGHDMFCPGTANLPDGRIHVSGGGGGSGQTSIYDPSTNRWTSSTPSILPRGYQGNATLSNGDVFSIGGSWAGKVGDKDAEVWSGSTGSWRSVSSIYDDYILTDDRLGLYRADNHAWLFSSTNGRLFHAGPSKNMHWFDPSGNGSVTAVGTRGTEHSMNGNAVMYDINKILTLGGAPNYDDSTATANAFLIDISTATPTVVKTTSLNYARGVSNSVVLPDGKVAVMGGQSFVKPFTDDNAVLVPELFDPATKTFRTMAPMASPRAYHSVAILLPDGRVLSGGGGLCSSGPCPSNHADMQIWSPPYLFNSDGSAAARPTLTSAPATAQAGSSITVNTGGSVSAFALIRLSSVTHSLNNEQRRLPLNFSSTGTNAYSVALPSDRGIVVPGFYMLFALNSAGVPSVSRMIRVD